MYHNSNSLEETPHCPLPLVTISIQGLAAMNIAEMGARIIELQANILRLKVARNALVPLSRLPEELDI
jgi:uncharacterized small protein (DUF1192 family)